MLPAAFMDKDTLKSFCDAVYGEGTSCTISDVDLDHSMSLVYRVVLPGCTEDSVGITIVDGIMSVSGDSSYGSFLAEFQCNSRMFDYTRLKSEFKDWIYTITVPSV
jgi:hypothetical protein